MTVLIFHPDPIETETDLAAACRDLISRVNALNDPRHQPDVFDTMARAVTAEIGILSALNSFHAEHVDEFAQRTNVLGGDIALAGQVVAQAMTQHPMHLDRDERFFFMTVYLASALHLLWCAASPEQKVRVPLPFVRDIVLPACQGKLAMLQVLRADQVTSAPSTWPGTGTYPPENPIHINMLLGHVDTALVPDMDDASGEVCLVQSRAIRNFLADGPLKTDPVRPVDLPWAWKSSGQALLEALETGFPEDIWPAYRN